MSPSRWQTVNHLFLECIPLADHERSAVLDFECGDDGELRSDVESLLAADRANIATGFLKPSSSVSLSRILLDDGAKLRNGPASGRQVGRYRLQALIGTGGTSEVYRASRVDDEGRAVEGSAPAEFAVKLLSRHMVTEEVLGRFRSEEKLLASINHPNVARYFDSGLTDDGLPFLVMELVDGQRIDRFSDDNELPIRARIELVLQICDAVESIHQRGVLHRDLTPPNILVTPQGVPKLVDFGIAKSSAPLVESLGTALQTVTGAIVGTPAYLSPEQAGGRTRTADVRTDIYTLGVLLYRLLTGRNPFQGVTLANLFDEICLSDPVPLSRINSGIPRPLETICLKCLQKEPRCRYVSADALADDLHRWLDHRPIEARQVSFVEYAARWFRRRPSIAALTAVLLLVVSAGLFAVVFLWRRAEAERDRAQNDLEFAGRLLAEISAFGSPNSGQLRVVNRDEIVAVLERTRNHIVRHLLQRPDDSAALYQLTNVDVQLARKYTSQRKLDEARTLLNECLECSDKIERLDPQDLSLPRRRFGARLVFAEVADEEGKYEECVDHLKLAVAHGQECMRLRPGTQLIGDVAYCRRSLAESFRRQGDDQEATSLILANLRMLDEVSKDNASPIIVIWRTLVRLDVHEFKATHRPRQCRRRIKPTHFQGSPRRKPMSWIRRAGRNWWPGA